MNPNLFDFDYAPPHTGGAIFFARARSPRIANPLIVERVIIQPMMIVAIVR